MTFRSWLSSLVSAALGLSALALGPGVHAQQAVDPDAQIVLSAMSNYRLKSFQVEYAAADEIVTPEGQKLQFLHSGEVTLKRPDKLHVIRRGAAGIGEIFLDGKKLSFFGKALDVYVQFDASSIASQTGPQLMPPAGSTPVRTVEAVPILNITFTCRLLRECIAGDAESVSMKPKRRDSCRRGRVVHGGTADTTAL